MGETQAADDDQTAANKKPNRPSPLWRVPEQLHAIDIAREAEQYRASQRAMEAAAARELFIEQFDAYTAVINDARTPWRNSSRPKPTSPSRRASG